MIKPCKKGHIERRKDGVCIACKRIRERRYIRKPDKEKCDKRRRARHAENPAVQMFKSARQRADKEGLPFEISVMDIKVPARCPWLDIPLFPGDGAKGDNSPSLDRIIPQLGYVRGNVKVISFLANKIKSSGTPEQVQAVADGMRGAYPQWLLIRL